MVNMNQLDESYAEEFEEVEKWVEKTHSENFGKYFTIQNKYKECVKEGRLSDEDLEVILTALPLDMFQVAEILNDFKLRVETIKMKIQSAKIEDGTDANASSDKILLEAYKIVIARVEKEMSYSRELIMSAKKIWDSRRAALGSMPVSEQDLNRPELPDYTPNRYIK